MNIKDAKIAIIGLGYVGLPLAVEFAKQYQTLGFDINSSRIQQLRDGKDITLEICEADLASLPLLSFSSEEKNLKESNLYIVTVPTPIDDNNTPDLNPLRKASAMIAQVINVGDIVIYESTVYPGVTEDICIPLIEEITGLTFNVDFYAGYSPERINPGDKVNTLTTIKKITSGSTPEIADFIDDLYSSIITAGTHKASSIKVAEAAKVIENTQRDLNIAIVNEFAKIFNKLNIDTEEVLNAAGTKWNFLKFKPGLVGGHCISVDPYYLTYKAQKAGYRPEVILAGRRINDGMGEYVAAQLVKKLASKKIHIDEARILIMGFTFKGDCPDVRNTKIIDLVKELQDFNMDVDVYDSWANADEVKQEYDIELITKLQPSTYDAIILAVDHSEIKSMGIDKIHSLGKTKHIVYDVKYVLDINDADIRL